MALKNDWIKIRITTDEKNDWKRWAQEKHMNLSQFIFYKVYCTHNEVPMRVQYQTKHDRPWEFDHKSIETKKGRKLPIIPGTPAWKKHQFQINRMNMINELKEKLINRKKIMQEMEA